MRLGINFLRLVKDSSIGWWLVHWSGIPLLSFGLPVVPDLHILPIHGQFWCICIGWVAVAQKVVDEITIRICECCFAKMDKRLLFQCNQDLTSNDQMTFSVKGPCRSLCMWRWPAPSTSVGEQSGWIRKMADTENVFFDTFWNVFSNVGKRFFRRNP